MSECACDEALLATLAERACRVAARAATAALLLLPPPAPAPAPAPAICCLLLLAALAVELGVGDRSAALVTPDKPARGRRDGLRLTRTVRSSSSGTGFFSSKLGRGRDLAGGGPVPGAAGLKREKSDFMAGALGLCGDRRGGRRGEGEGGRESRRGRQQDMGELMERRASTVDRSERQEVAESCRFVSNELMGAVVICCFGLLATWDGMWVMG